MKTVVVNDHSFAYFPKKWKYCIGTGRLGLALQKEYVDHLARLQKELNFQYIRGHGLLHDDIGIYRERKRADGTVEPFYNFTYIDRIFDTFLELNIRPFVEIGFMPKLLASGEQTIFDWQGNVTPPKDYDQWKQLIQAVISHFIDRYGVEEVTKWPFEIWNEPNLINFWQHADKKEYFKLYKITARAIKEVHPYIQVGGPAICGGSDEWITDFLQFCHKEEVPVDFVSRHAYTSAKPHKVTPDYYYQELYENTHMLDELKSVKELIQQSPFPNLPFHITEYNTSYSPINPVHDTVLNAAYLARILSEAGDIVDSFSYWTFSDVFEEAGVPTAPFHGGFGLIALHGIAKPTYHLFSFFNQLGEQLLYRDSQMVVTKKQDGSIQLVVWNLIMEKGEGLEQTVQIELPTQSDAVFIKRKTIDETNGNPWRVWKEMWRPRFPKKNEIDTLQEVAQPLIRTERRDGLSRTLKLELTLSKNEVSLVEVFPIIDETNTYPGLDDRLIPSY
ncbi:xylan 1,4-beta-xylosidase [Halalkalibacterium halodurans]|uniref:GH39 family glycosyl hydrolase n=1 Tax=Halalkalibacterium halodurans TaxID=86665 RepID=UPI002E249DEB|nr:xylan 1,4-beta-xylosidase [Halalkalibacterium halodurans]